MEIAQVETFLAVSTFGGFHRAAEALRVSQPAVSSRIRALEESLGVRLFVRSRNSLMLSSAGRLFVSGSLARSFASQRSRSNARNTAGVSSARRLMRLAAG